MIAIYNGSFNPQNPGENVFAYNDNDPTVTPGSAYLVNSRVTVALTAGETVAIMVTLSGDPYAALAYPGIAPSRIYSEGLGVLTNW